jgi:succinate dehydrogenase/fumarate reductase flavoprotein subunit
MHRRKTVFVEADILVVGGGMGGCGATYELVASITP